MVEANYFFYKRKRQSNRSWANQMRLMILLSLILLPGGAVMAQPVMERPTVTRTGALSGFGDTTIRFPKSGVERSGRIVEDDGGYLDLARSKDGRQLWVRRWWDDGSTEVNRFQLNWKGDRRLILQFVDGVTEPSTTGPGVLGLRIIKVADRWVEQILDAWPVDPGRKEAFNLTTHTWIPLVAARHQVSTDVRRLQWMVFVGACTEVKGPCVYYGAPEDICGKYFDELSRPGDGALWIAPKKCSGHW